MCSLRAVFLLTAVACSGAVQVQGPTAIQRVTKLLQEMQSQLEAERDADEKAYEKMQCWCNSGSSEKKKLITDSDLTIEQLESSIQANSAAKGKYEAEIGQLKKDLAEQKQSLKTVSAAREKEQAEFRADEKEKVQAISMMKNAIGVLGKHNSGFLQTHPELQESLHATLRYLGLKHEEMKQLRIQSEGWSKRSFAAGSELSLLDTSLRGADGVENGLISALRGRSNTEVPTQIAAQVLAAAAAEVNVRGTVFAQQPSSYSSQSGGIFGILQQMQEDFENALKQAQEKEQKAQAEFDTLKDASENQIDAGTTRLDETQEKHAQATKDLSDNKEDLEATRQERAEAVKFLETLQVQCQSLDEQMKDRTKGRNAEIKAVADTIGILTDDASRALFAKKMGTGSFLQLRAARRTVHRADDAESAARTQAVAFLRDSARKYQSVTLGEMAVMMQIDAFKKVIDIVQKKIDEMKVQQEEEVKRKASCIEDLRADEKSMYHAKKELDDQASKVASLKDLMEQLDERIKQAQAEIKGLEVDVKTAGLDRKAENEAFQAEVNDQRAMQHILAKAIDRFSQTYKSALLQEKKQAPPVQFQPYKQNAGSSGILAMLEAIVEDSKAEEAKVLKAESEAQASYEEYIKESSESIASLNDVIHTKKKAMASASSEKSKSEAIMADVQETYNGLEQNSLALHQECDFLLENFDMRQETRMNEIVALKQSIALFKGMR